MTDNVSMVPPLTSHNCRPTRHSIPTPSIPPREEGIHFDFRVFCNRKQKTQMDPPRSRGMTNRRGVLIPPTRCHPPPNSGHSRLHGHSPPPQAGISGGPSASTIAHSPISPSHPPITSPPRRLPSHQTPDYRGSPTIQAVHRLGIRRRAG